MKLGSHVSVSGKGLLAAAKEAIKYDSDTFMIYTGAPQNTKRRKVEDMFIEEGKKLMKEHGIEEFIVHAPYIINLASPKEDTFQMSVDFLRQEIVRTEAMGSKYIVIHPGAHVGTGEEKGLERIIEGLNKAMSKDQTVSIALEMMAGKGSELNYRFEHAAKIIEKAKVPEKISVCFDTCHTHDAGYDIVNKNIKEKITVEMIFLLIKSHTNGSSVMYNCSKVPFLASSMMEWAVSENAPIAINHNP